MPTTGTKPMTEPQFKFLIGLIGQAYAGNATLRAAKLVEAAGYDFSTASTQIDHLKAKVFGTPGQPKAKPVAIMPEYVPPFGSYLIDGSIVDVKKPKYDGAPIYVYKDGAYAGAVGFKANAIIASLDSDETAHAAVIAYAKATGKCGVCHTKLTDRPGVDRQGHRPGLRQEVRLLTHPRGGSGPRPWA